MNNLIEKMIEVDKKRIKYSEDLLKESDQTKQDNLTTIDEIMGKPKPPEDNHIVIIQDGGIGDCICATPMLESARKIFKDKKIIFSSFYPEIFFNNPNVDKLYGARSPEDLYETWVKPLRNFRNIMKCDMYNLPIYRLFPGKLSQAFCYAYKLPYPGDNLKVYITKEEDKEAQKFLSSFPRPVILIQPYGGRMNFNEREVLTDNKNWFKEEWEEVVKELTISFDVVQVGGLKEDPIKGITTYLMGATNIRQTIALVKNSLTFVTVDSFLNHVGPAVDKSGVVLFGRSNPYIYGHDLNRNIWIENSCDSIGCGRPESYYGDVRMYKGMIGNWECQSKKCMKAITPEIVIKKVYEAIEINTREKNK